MRGLLILLLLIAGADAEPAGQAAVREGPFVTISPATIALVQRRLNLRGYDSGPVDGIWGERTSLATRSYQLDHQLFPNGLPSLSLIHSMALDMAQAPPVLPPPRWRGGKDIFLSPPLIAQMQRRLNRRGYDAGAVDGDWDSDTRAAARQYQGDLGLHASGCLDLSLLAALLGEDVLGEAGAGYDLNATWRDLEGERLRVDPLLLRQLQIELNAQGVEAGPVDGEWDDRLAGAVENYQRSAGLYPSASISLELLADLDLGQGER